MVPATVRLAGLLLFFLMLVVPTAYSHVKAALLAIVLASIALDAISRRRLALHPAIACGTAAFVAAGLLFVLVGVWRGAPGALKMTPVYVVWPVVYTLLLTKVVTIRHLRQVLCVLFVSLVVICLYSIIYILWAAGWWPDALYLPLALGQAVSFRGGIIEFNLYSITSLLFLVPFAIAAIFAWPRATGPIPRALLCVGAVLGAIVTVLSDRRGLILVVSISPLLAFILSRLAASSRMKPRVWKVAGGVLVVAGLAGIALHWTQGLDPFAFAREFSSGFEFGTDPIAMLRASQFQRLVDGWLQFPVLGAGLGAVIDGLIRSPETPWAFELSYAMLLFNTGLLGLVWYTLGIAAIFVVGLQIVRSSQPLGKLMFPVLIGSAAFLIANATNPYLLKFDSEWVVFLPLAFINAWLLRQPAASAVPVECDR